MEMLHNFLFLFGMLAEVKKKFQERNYHQNDTSEFTDKLQFRSSYLIETLTLMMITENRTNVKKAKKNEKNIVYRFKLLEYLPTCCMMIEMISIQ